MRPHRTPTRRQLLARAGALSLPLLAGGCLGLGSGPAPRRFRLNSPTGVPADLPTADWTLEVDSVVADPGIDTTRIAQLAANGMELQYFAQAEWPDKAADMVTTLLLQTFIDSGKSPRVGDRNSAMRADFVLKCVLRDFQAEGAGTPTVKVTMTASLVQLPRRLQAGSQRFQAAVPAASGALEDIVRAFEQALGRVLVDIVAWTLTTGAAAPRPAG